MKSCIRSNLLQADIKDCCRPSSSRLAKDKTSTAAHQFELRHNTSPRWTRRRRERRQGQALLLAVLIMLLAALLGAGFLAVVSGNLNQSARIADKTRAIEASRAGVAYANAQLSGSSQGDLWRPIDVNPAPVTGDANYDVYYSQLDKVQGWANTAVPPIRGDYAGGTAGDADYHRARLDYRDAVYAKFPAPEQATSDAPKFLVKTEAIPNDPAVAGYDADHAGEIKITAIGLSHDDPNVFHKSIAYKAGRLQSPWASALRSISNWEFGTNERNTGVPYADEPVIVGTTASPNLVPTLPAANVLVNVNATGKPRFSGADVPFNVVIVKRDGAPTVRGAVVTNVDASGTQLTFARLDNAIAPSETIQKAAALGTASTIDLLNTGKMAQQLPANFLTFPTQLQSSGIRANGSVWLQGQIRLSDLSKFGSKIRASGSIALDSLNKPVAAPTSLPNPNYGIAGNGVLVSSDSASFPGTFTTDSGNDVSPLDLIEDGWNKIGAQKLGLDYSSNARDVKPFVPAKIDSTENLARYRALTRNSADGIYIDNREDFEKVVDNATTNPPTFRAMTQAQLVEMLTSPLAYAVGDPDAPEKIYTRKSPSALAASVASLEQRHLRGWVGTDEFLARGALVELIAVSGIPKIRVTRDARSDLNPVGPELTKTLRDGSGNYQAGVYSQTLDWPVNGMLLAEGNVRVRGDITLPRVTAGSPDPHPSLTIVSLGNIYIEGKLSVDNTTVNVGGQPVPDPDRKKLMLLARHNVIVNPTRAVLARTDVQTVATNQASVVFAGTTASPGVTGAASTKAVSVADASLFNAGDYVTIGAGQNKSVRGVITSLLPNNQIQVKTNDTFTLLPASLGGVFNVRSALEERVPDDPTQLIPANYFSLVDLENAVNRRVLSPVFQGTPTNTSNVNNKLIFDHFAERRQTAGGDDGLNVKAEDFSITPLLVQRPATFVARLTNKQDLVGSTQNNNPDAKSITSTNKVLRTYNNYPALPNPTNQKHFTATAAKTLTALATEISGSAESDTSGPMPQGYKYTATPTNPLSGNLPSHALSGIGLRYGPAELFTPSNQPSANNRRQDFNADPNAVPPVDGFTIPLATTVEFNLNGTPSDIGIIGDGSTIRYFGFAPAFRDPEDALTIDSGFYQLRNVPAKSTLDFRPFKLPISGAATQGLTSPLPSSIVLRRSGEYGNTSGTSPHGLLPSYFVRAMKVTSYGSSNDEVLPTGGIMQINAFVYAQQGSWLVIPGDYFRSVPAVRAEVNPQTGAFIGSYIDYDNDAFPDANEYVVNGQGKKAADLNRNGAPNDPGEIQAVLAFMRYNTVQVEFFGSIIENQTAIVADVIEPNVGTTVVKGSVQDWMDKWASYNDSGQTSLYPGAVGGATANLNNFKFIQYKYDDSILLGSGNAHQLRVPVTDDLLYQQ